MARNNIKKNSSLKEMLLSEGHSFSFYQAVRLLSRIQDENRINSSDQENKRVVRVISEGLSEKKLFQDIRVRPNLSLSFPKSEIEKIEEDHTTGIFEITVNFLSLYGTLSPLPTFYTEDLINEERADESYVRDFLDIVNSRLYEHLFSVWSKYRSMIQVMERNQAHHIEKLYSIGGFGEQKIRDKVSDSFGLLRYMGLFSMPTRSREGLKTLLSDYLKHLVHVEHFIERTVNIPERQRFSLGVRNCTLHSDGSIGSETRDRMGTFKVIMSPVSIEEYRDYFPGSEKSNHLIELIRLYVSAPLLFTIEVTLKKEETHTVMLGQESNNWGALGLDTWMFSGERPHEPHMTLYS